MAIKILMLLMVGALLNVSYAGVLPADRTVDWSQAGVAGGIPNVTTIFTNMSGLDNTGNTDISAALNAAIVACPSNQVVSIPPGLFLTTGAIGIGNGVVVRGQGNNTVIVGNYGGVIFNFSGPRWYGWQTNLASGYTKGSTNIVLSGLPVGGYDLAVGAHIQITESNDVSLVQQCGGDGCVGEYALGQWVKITGMAGTTITFWPPLMWTYTNTLSPIISYPVNGSDASRNFIDHAGVESLIVSNISSGGTVNFEMQWAGQCWIKNVKSYFGSVSHVWLFDTYRCEIRDSLFSGVTGPITSSRCYGMQLGTPNIPNPSSKTSSLLCENNVWANCRGSIVVGYGAAGNVFDYNYFVNETNETPSILRGDIYLHSAHPIMNLFEGNVGSCINADDFHGSSSHNVIFRNWWKGRDDAKITVSGLRSVELDVDQSFYSILGNTLGYSGITNDIAALTSPTGVSIYQALVPASAPYGNAWKAEMFGYDGEGGGTLYYATNAFAATNVFATALVTGNFDYFNNATVWDTNGVQTIPDSLTYAAQPAWWNNYGTLAWPRTGTNSIPAMLWYEGNTNSGGGGGENTNLIYYLFAK